MNSEEFKSIWLPLSGRFYRVAFYILESQEDAEDAVQDLFSRLWKMRDSLGSVKNPVAFGITVIRNICLDKLRSKQANRTIKPAPEVFESVPDPEADLNASLIGNQEYSKVFLSRK